MANSGLSDYPAFYMLRLYRQDGTPVEYEDMREDELARVRQALGEKMVEASDRMIKGGLAILT